MIVGVQWLGVMSSGDKPTLPEAQTGDTGTLVTAPYALTHPIQHRPEQHNCYCAAGAADSWSVWLEPLTRALLAPLVTRGTLTPARPVSDHRPSCFCAIFTNTCMYD